MSKRWAKVSRARFAIRCGPGDGVRRRKPTERGGGRFWFFNNRGVGSGSGREELKVRNHPAGKKTRKQRDAPCQASAAPAGTGGAPPPSTARLHKRENERAGVSGVSKSAGYYRGSVRGEGLGQSFDIIFHFLFGFCKSGKAKSFLRFEDRRAYPSCARAWARRRSRTGGRPRGGWWRATPGPCRR